MTNPGLYYFPIDLLAFHRPRQQLRKYVSEIPVLKQESRRSVWVKGHLPLSSFPGQVHSRSRKLHAEMAERRVPSREVRGCARGAVCGEEGRFVCSAQQVRQS